MKAISLSSGAGEVMAPHTLMTVLVLSPDGTLTLDPGALHGRSEIEHSLRLAKRREEIPSTQTYWFIWVAVELDPIDLPLRYKGMAASELFVDTQSRTAYKNLSEHVNQMSRALRGELNIETLNGKAKAAIAQQLKQLDATAWDRSASSLKEALGS